MTFLQKIEKHSKQAAEKASSKVIEPVVMTPHLHGMTSLRIGTAPIPSNITVFYFVVVALCEAISLVAMQPIRDDKK